MSSGATFGQGLATPSGAGTVEHFEISVPVRDLVPSVRPRNHIAPRRINPLANEPDAGKRGTWDRGSQPIDPLAARAVNPASRTPAYQLRFNGSRNPAACAGCTPPDTTGDVGPSHYIQLVNATKVAIYNKSGILLKSAFDLGDLWSSGACTNNLGDPQVRYDPMAKRWLLSQFAQTGNSGPFYICFAISQTADPLGSYYLFQFNVPEFPDYFKVGVWPGGYYVGTNETNYSAYAFDRTRMVNGNPNAKFVRFTGQTNFLMPADMDGAQKPGGGGLFYTFKDSTFHGGAYDRIELFQLTPNFTATPAIGTFKKIAGIRIAPFTYTVCGFFHLNCISQKGTSQKFDAVSEWPMQRLAYRKFPGREVMVGNFTVGGGHGTAGAAIRWFELRNTGSGWGLYQEGTLDINDGIDRFMGSIAMDKKGNIALGYSVSGAAIYPGVRYVARAAGDPLGTMGIERVLIDSGGAQTGSNRWGDYSAMAVDPSTDCQFWYTNQYYQVNAATNWKTIVGAFTMPGCQ